MSEPVISGSRIVSTAKTMAYTSTKRAPAGSTPPVGRPRAIRYSRNSAGMMISA